MEAMRRQVEELETEGRAKEHQIHQLQVEVETKGELEVSKPS